MLPPNPYVTAIGITTARESDETPESWDDAISAHDADIAAHSGVQQEVQDARSSTQGTWTALKAHLQALWDWGTGHVAAYNHADIALNTAKRHNAVTAGTGISISGQQVTNSDTGSMARAAHEETFNHGLLHAQSHALASADHTGQLTLEQLPTEGATLTTGGLTFQHGIYVGGTLEDSGYTVRLVPAGAVMAFAMQTPPDGWLECNGQAISRTEYPALFAAIGTIYGAGDTTTFTVPDLRGEFVRGWDHERGVDSGRSLGSAQAGELQSHEHALTLYGHASGQDGFTMNDGTSSPLHYTTDSTGGTETRPRNVALLYCIKY